MEKMFVVRAVGTDELGVETPTTIPMKLAAKPEVETIEHDLDAQYPHLKHRVVEIEELKTPGQVEDWQHSYLGSVFGSEHQVNENEEKVD
ncbi:hypothetical protein [Larkinella rosea]|uniref:Uncharacterized protein n=1 Tax=Larkinella rosea TaxID=2025312 RepID=A0A3P1C0V2_9BACT|nr:hypothetical protein [Larkinella rosea]RRB06756.1 hypothetical protein EHT25_02875 [Larkinella rosea]